ncbi:MAG: serine hydrolase [Lachnospiraceae bacterium]|nr:serine hydrolase [Lachnospiraceae bacterium]
MNPIEKKTGLALIAFLILLTGLCGCQSKGEESQEDTASTGITISEQDIEAGFIEKKEYKEFIETAESYLDRCEFQGSVLVAKGDEIIWAQGYGSSDSKDEDAPSNTMNTVYEAGSITKQMTAAAILQLQEQGKLSVSDCISKYFPKYKYGDQITLKMLLTMHSGLSDYINDPEGFFGEELGQELIQKEYDGESVDRDLPLQYFYDVPLLSEPGSRMFYCNTNYYLLALIVEQVSGISYDDYMQQNIFDRCGMNHANREFQKTDAKGYDKQGRYFSIPAGLAFGCGDVNDSVIDIFKWDRALQNGTVISEASFQEMTASKTYGYGVYADSTSILHGGSTDVFNAYNIMYRKDDVTIVVMINKPIEESSSTAVAGNIRKIYLDVMQNY